MSSSSGQTRSTSSYTPSRTTTYDPTPSSTQPWMPPPPLEPTTTRPPNNNNNGPNLNPTPGSSAALYLYTFLATLILLLGVSSAIVIRSLILRRRHRRMVEEAIRNGTWIPASNGNNRRVDLSKKPKMFEAFVAEEDLEQGLTDNEGKLKQVASVGSNHAEWGIITPFSLVAVEQPSSSASEPVVEEPPAAQPTFYSRLRSAPFLRSRSTPTPSPPLAPVTAAANTPSIPGSVHVSVLIAMPSRTPLRRTAADEESALPHLQIGVATVPVTGHEDALKRMSGESV